MFGTNPFATLAGQVPDGFMRTFIVMMAVFVVLGVLFDIAHKGSARYFFDNWRRSREKGKGDVPLASIAVQTALVDVLASGEFCNPRRRVAHLLTMYGFVIYIATTVMMVFGSHPAGPVPLLWWTGALMVLAGGCWFWFFIRVDVSAEGNSPLRVVRADLFILSLLVSVTLGLAWAWTGGGMSALFRLYILSTAILFGTVYWSKFAHMFFKPAAAFEKRVSNADGTRSNLPAPADKPGKLGRQVKHARHY
jgi:hypothetical protein